MPDTGRSKKSVLTDGFFVPLSCYNQHGLLQRGVAQLVARTAGGREAAGSSPVTPTTSELISTPYKKPGV